jgi:hypothetical protein
MYVPGAFMRLFLRRKGRRQMVEPNAVPTPAPMTKSSEWMYGTPLRAIVYALLTDFGQLESENEKSSPHHGHPNTGS